MSNAGPDSAADVAVTDDKAGKATYASGDANSNGMLDVSETWTFTATYTVLETDPDPLKKATVTSTTSDPKLYNNEASWTVDVLHPSIDVEKTGPQYAHEGDTITYTITVKNTGDCPLFKVEVKDSLLGTIYSDGLDVGEEETFKVKYTVKKYGLLKNTVTASGEDKLGRKVSDSASWTVVVLPKSMVITSRLCYFDLDSSADGQQFRLIFTQDPTVPNTYKLTASNPGQFYYNVFYIGTSDDPVSLMIKIPYPFVTQGAVPIHVYSGVSIVDGCFLPSGDITSIFTIDPKSIALEDYTNGYVEITVSGSVPGSGLVYVTIHLDYGLKKTVGYTPDSEKNADKPAETDAIVNGALYIFDVSGDLTDS